MRRSPSFDQFLREVLLEDLGSGDVTSKAVIPAGRAISATVIARSSGVVAGTRYACRLFRAMSPGVRCEIVHADGRVVRSGQVILDLRGPARAIFAAERTALNLLGHLCGIATLARQFVDRVRPHRVKVLDTRKTLPGLRMLEKEAVRAGGGVNHRMRLDDGILIKTNHLRVLGAGSGSRVRAIHEAITNVRRRHPRLPVEIEVTTLDEVRAALEAGADMLLLDNMDLGRIRASVRLRDMVAGNGRSPSLEVSGGVMLKNVREIAATGVDRIAIGRLTHSAPSLDVALCIA